MTPPIISNVSDTARWVAVYRARESVRPDAIFRDPFAERLAGERGRHIARNLLLPEGTANGWPIVTRTKILDDMVMASIEEGCTCVLNLAAGLDARPYRLPLPKALRWIEADLPGIIDEKERALAGEKPRCSLERVRIDLADVRARTAWLDAIATRAERTLVITEGLLVYLEDSLVAELGRNLAAHSNFAFWAFDISSPQVLKYQQRKLSPQFMQAPLKFAPKNGLSFFESLGWTSRNVRSLLHEGARLRRVPWMLRPLAWVPPADPRTASSHPWSVVVRLEHRRRVAAKS